MVNKDIVKARVANLQDFRGFRQRGILLLLLILMFFYTGTGQAALATGQGDGSGGGKDQPLSLSSSIPADGQRDVSLTTEIVLSFSKNVVYMTVCENNKKCLALYAADGNKIPVEVIMADDQIEPEKRRDLQLKPLQSLKPATSYTIKISPELQSKSGVTVGQEITVSFTTAGAAPDNVGDSKDSSSDKSSPDSAVSGLGEATADSKDEKESSVDTGGGTPASTGSASKPAAALDPVAGKEASPAEQVPDVLPVDGASFKGNLAGNEDMSGEIEAEAEIATGTLVDEEPAMDSKGRPIVIGIAVAAVLGYVFYRNKRAGNK